MEKEMATHSSILAWKNPWTEESGGLKSMGLHDWACVHEGGGRWVGSNKLVEIKKKKEEEVKMNSSHFIVWSVLDKVSLNMHKDRFQSGMMTVMIIYHLVTFVSIIEQLLYAGH